LYLGGDLGDRRGLLVSVHRWLLSRSSADRSKIGQPPGVSGGL
jgi:hypothetical protein